MGSDWFKSAARIVVQFLVFVSVLEVYKYHSKGVQGAIQCACSTSQCQRDVTSNCKAETFCYVQIIPPLEVATKPVDSLSRLASSDDDDVEVVRGCIDETTPLLCENRRPLSYVDVQDATRLAINTKGHELANKSLQHSGVHQNDYAETDYYYNEQDIDPHLDDDYEHRLSPHRRNDRVADTDGEAQREGPRQFLRQATDTTVSPAVGDEPNAAVSTPRGEPLLIALSIVCLLLAIGTALALAIATRTCQQSSLCRKLLAAAETDQLMPVDGLLLDSRTSQACDSHLLQVFSCFDSNDAIRKSTISQAATAQPLAACEQPV